MLEFLYGALSMASVAIGLCFLKYWRRSRDRLFLGFALAFWLLGVNWCLLPFVPGDEARSWVYLIRIAAFGVLVWAIVDKNRRATGRLRDDRRAD